MYLLGSGMVFEFSNGWFIRGIFLRYPDTVSSVLIDVVPYFNWIQTTIEELHSRL